MQSRSSAHRIKVKVCGVTCREDAALAVELGADFLGLNFYPSSPRYVTPRRARAIVEAVAGRARTVGVFVNAPRREVEQIADEVGLDLLQFHGDETEEEIAPFAERAIKVVRVSGRLDDGALSGYDRCWGVLIDSRHPQLYGGSGSGWDFASLRAGGTSAGRLPPRLFIAGGLRPGNVEAAVAAARPFGIDLCSGVERRPGRKDRELLERLFKEIDHGESLSTA